MKNAKAHNEALSQSYSIHFVLITGTYFIGKDEKGHIRICFFSRAFSYVPVADQLPPPYRTNGVWCLVALAWLKANDSLRTPSDLPLVIAS